MDRLKRIPAWAWLALGFLLRAGFAASLGSRSIQTDESAFSDGAWNLAAAGRLIPPVTASSPFATFAFSLFYRFGHYPVLPRLFNAVVSIATAWMIGRATRDLTGSERAGRFALALSCVYPFFIYWSGVLMSETLYTAFIVWGTWELGKSLLGRSELAGAARAGLSLGLAGITRPEGAYIWAVIWGFAAAACLARRWSWKAWSLALLCWALPLIALCARNQAGGGRFALDLHSGSTLLHGTMFFDQNEIDTAVAVKAMESEPFYQEAQKLPPAERDKVLTHKAFEFMREHPRTVLRQWARKFVNFWRFYPRSDKPFIENTVSHPGAGLSRKALVAISLCFEPWLVTLGVLGLVFLTLYEPRLFPMPLFLLGTLGIHMLSVSQMRYRVPVTPWLILAASWLLCERMLPRAPEERPRTRP